MTETKTSLDMMKKATTIREMMKISEIYVPDYQRPYSWDTPENKQSTNTQTDVFIDDLKAHAQHVNNDTKTPYYFGHFLFEYTPEANNKFAVIDGQQRLTTIVIFLAALFENLKAKRKLDEYEEELYKHVIIDRKCFSTVEYDNNVMTDYVFEKNETIDDKSKDSLESKSQKRIVTAYKYFMELFQKENEYNPDDMLNVISQATCTTHVIGDKAEAIQMFIFQNNRGKKPSNLDVIKAEFMFHIHLYGGVKKDSLIGDMNNRFKRIYRFISAIEQKIHEDTVLLYAARVHFNDLNMDMENATDKIRKKLNGEKTDKIDFIKKFALAMEASFKHLKAFFVDEEKNNKHVHSLITLGEIGIAIPFILKAYSFRLGDKVGALCSALEKLVLRQRVIGTRAKLATRLDDEAYEKFTKDNQDIQPIVDRIEWMIKTTQENNPQEYYSWHGYWNNHKFKESLQGEIQHPVAKFLLWKYENYLGSQGKSGYATVRFDNIVKKGDVVELEHIAPRTIEKGDKKLANGYWTDEYKDEDKQYINCLGNYLLISKSHNCSIGNKPFVEKRATYEMLNQQREIQEMTKESQIWDKEKIQKRKNKIIKFILEEL